MPALLDNIGALALREGQKQKARGSQARKTRREELQMEHLVPDAGGEVHLNQCRLRGKGPWAWPSSESRTPRGTCLHWVAVMAAEVGEVPAL